MAIQRRRRMQFPTILSRDLLNLALVLAFLHLDPDAYLGISRNGNNQSLLNYQNIQPNMYSNKILDDLSALGHFTNPAANQFNFDQPFEISAYILNAETTFQDTSAVNIYNNQNQSQSLSTNEHNSSNEANAGNLDEGSEQNNILDGQGGPNAVINDNNDIDSGVSDVDSGHQSSGEDFEDNLSSFQPSEASASPAQLGELDDASDWILRSEIKIEEPEVPPPLLLDNFDVLFDTDESSNIFRDLDDIIGTPNAIPDTSQVELNDMEFAPDEEDVENQLMHIDDQLIRLDENIEDITDHLDEQLLNTATVENDALLSAEEENLLFSSMPEVMDLDQNWQLADPRDQEIEELIAAGLPSPLMPSPFMVAVDDEPKEFTGENPVLVKQEIKEEPIEGQDESQLYHGNEHDLDWLEPYMSPVMSPADSLASSNLPADLLSSVEEETSSHLLDHNYALSPYDECFGASQDGLAASSLSPKSSHSSATNIEFEGGATSQISASSSGGGLTASQRLSRDERKAKQIGLPFLVADIIDLPIDAFNELLTRHTLTEDQLMLCRDIRRRGKNKVAAQNCRKRKMDLISELEEQVNKARRQKESLLAEREELYRLRDEWTHKLLNLETDVLRGLNRKVNDYTFDYSGASVAVTRLVKSKA